ncbi:MAG: ABC transporter substrate-binding protein [Pseudomonadota bacterium]
MVQHTRRQALIGATSVAILAGVSPAWALDSSGAKAHVSGTISELKALLQSAGSGASRAPELKRIMETRSDMPLIAKFSAGRAWRDMNTDQQGRFVSAFSHYISVVYARRFDEYSGDPQIDVGRTRDAGRKGVLVETPITLPGGEKVAVEWLVNDRAGPTKIYDMLIEGISMVVTQREEIGQMLARRNDNVEDLIRDLASKT